MKNTIQYMAKNKHILMSGLLALALSGCFDGGSNSSAPTADNNQPAFNPTDFTLSQQATLQSGGETKVQVQLNNLPSDDAIYITATSDDISNGMLELTPSKTVLNPNDGNASFVLLVKDLGLLSAPSIQLNITTSGNQSMQQSQMLEWGN